MPRRGDSGIPFVTYRQSPTGKLAQLIGMLDNRIRRSTVIILIPGSALSMNPNAWAIVWKIRRNYRNNFELASGCGIVLRSADFQVS